MGQYTAFFRIVQPVSPIRYTTLDEKMEPVNTIGGLYETNHAYALAARSPERKIGAALKLMNGSQTNNIGLMVMNCLSLPLSSAEVASSLSGRFIVADLSTRQYHYYDEGTMPRARAAIVKNLQGNVTGTQRYVVYAIESEGLAFLHGSRPEIRIQQDVRAPSCAKTKLVYHKDFPAHPPEDIGEYTTIRDGKIVLPKGQLSLIPGEEAQREPRSRRIVVDPTRPRLSATRIEKR